MNIFFELCVFNGIQGGTLKPWPEFVEGLVGGVLAGEACLFCKFLVSFVLQRPINLLPSVRIKKAELSSPASFGG